MYKKVLFFVLVVFSLRGVLYSSGYGTAGAQIINLSASARPASMGYAMGAVKGDINSVVYNPAALFSIKGKRAQFSHLVYFLDTSMSSLTYGQNIGKVGSGVKLKIFSAEDIERNSFGEKIDNYAIRFSQVSAAAGMLVAERIAAGGALKVVGEKYDVEDSLDASAFAFDLGLWLRGLEGDSFGLVIKNLGPQMKVGDVKVKLDRKAVLAGAHEMKNYIFVWEISTARQYSVGFRTGVEFSVHELLKIRAGGNYITKFDFMGGFGLNWNMWELDYAFIPHLDMGLTHRISMGIVF